MIIAAGVFLGVLAIIIFATLPRFSSPSWEVAQQVDPITDVSSVEAHILSHDGRSRMGIFCADGELALGFETPHLMALRRSDDADVVTIVRIDRNQPKYINAGAIERTIYVAGSAQLPSLFEEMRSSQRVVVRANSPSMDREIDMTFSTRGAAAAIRAVQESCARS